MFHHHETNESPYEVSPEMLSPDRPPQLNKTINGCGCRCGIGGAADGDEGGSSDDDNASTLVGPSDNSDSEDSFPPSSDGPEQHVNTDAFERSSIEDGRQMNEVRTRYSVFENGVDGFRLSQHMVAMEEWPLRLRRVQVIPDDMADSMKNEAPGSDDHSVVTPDTRSVARMSPGPAIGYWAVEDLELNNFHEYEYHFLVRPLRLTPQPRYCRGRVASHMVLPDDESFGHGG